MSRLRWLWRELIRPRGGQHRFYRVGRRSRAGVALMLVLSSLLFMMIIVTEITHGATVRVQLAAHQRDEAEAEALARTGLGIYQLVLMASKQLGQQFGAMMAQYGLGSDTLWQMVPFINTGMMRMLLVSGADLQKQDMQQYQEQGLTDEQRARSMEESKTSTQRNFLDFDGDFFAQVQDEDSKLYVGDITATSYAQLLENDRAIRLYALMSGPDNDQFFYDQNLDRWQLIGDLADWTDADNERLYQGGREDALYQSLPDPYLPKNAGFDSMEEIRLVNGWNRDDVWERFSKDITIYGSGKVNVNTADRNTLLALMRAYVTPTTPDFEDQLLGEIELYRSMASYPSAQAFTQHLESLGATVDPRMNAAVTNQSSVFHVTSTGQVRDAVVTIDAIIDFSQSRLGKIVSFKIR